MGQHAGALYDGLKRRKFELGTESQRRRIKLDSTLSPLLLDERPEFDPPPEVGQREIRQRGVIEAGTPELEPSPEVSHRHPLTRVRKAMAGQPKGEPRSLAGDVTTRHAIGSISSERRQGNYRFRPKPSSITVTRSTSWASLRSYRLRRWAPLRATL